jgi:hypothetical protein
MGDDAFSDEALKEAPLSEVKGVAGECELMDSWRTLDVGDCPTEDTDCRWEKLLALFASWSLDAERAISSMCLKEGNC